jgi:hypothetical protein
LESAVSRFWTSLAFAVCLSGAIACSARAGGLTTLTFEWAAAGGKRPTGAVTANGVRVMTVRGGGWAAVNAAKAAAEVLQSAVWAGVTPDAIKAEKATGGFAVEAGDRRVILVDQDKALGMNSSREALANEWVKLLRGTFAASYLVVPVDSQIVPVGEKRMIAMSGTWQRVQITADDQIVKAECDPVTRTLSLVGMTPGDAPVTLDTGMGKVVVRVKVMRYAGHLLPAAEAAVTGRIASVDVIERAASAAVYYAVDTEPGASAEITDMLVNQPNLTPGDSATVTMRVTIAGEGYLPVTASPQVRVVNEAIEPTEATVLMVSNRPERIPSYGLWYLGHVPSGHPARLLYHHVNSSPGDAELAVELVNTSDSPLRVQIVEACGGPSRDEVFVGHKAAREFLKRQADDVGYVVAIPGGCTYTAFAVLLHRGEVISGLTEMRVLGDGELRVGVRLRPSSTSIVTPTAEVPEDRISSWVFSEPHKHLQATYRVGSTWAFATIGDKQVLSATGRELLDGDYGVFYDVTFDIENPTMAPAPVELVLMPGGGLARGMVMIDGQIYETGLLRYGETQRLYVVTVPAGGRQELRVRTMPQAGSNYPIKLVMRPKGAWE